jgi:hypothetical protein
MPRSIQEILDHADELAARFEDYEPAEDDEHSVEEFIGAVLGTSAQAAQQRYGTVVKST